MAATTLDDVEALCRERGEELGLASTSARPTTRASWSTWIQEARGAADGIIINAGACTHTSIALLDALQCRGAAGDRGPHLQHLPRARPSGTTPTSPRRRAGVICGLGGAWLCPGAGRADGQHPRRAMQDLMANQVQPCDPDAIRQLADDPDRDRPDRDRVCRGRTPHPRGAPAPWRRSRRPGRAARAGGRCRSPHPRPPACRPRPPHPGAVTSPMVGIVYLAPEPGRRPSSRVGDQVAQGQTLLLIEAMKTFNQIRAPRPAPSRRSCRERHAGRIRRAADGHRVSGVALMFEKVLIANRGEIALRIHRACQEMGIRPSPCTPPPTPTRCMCAWPTRASASARRRRATATSTSPAILSAAAITGADAIHPGYGFLSENADFAEMVEEHGLAFIGPLARAYPHDGRQDRRQGRDRGGSACRWCPARDGPVPDVGRGARSRRARSATRC